MAVGLSTDFDATYSLCCVLGVDVNSQLQVGKPYCHGIIMNITHLKDPFFRRHNSSGRRIFACFRESATAQIFLNRLAAYVVVTLAVKLALAKR